jgi:release factor glutamine methyltransferase
MGVNIQTIKEIRSYLAKELEELYQKSEINALANIIIKTEIGVSRLHGLYLTEHPVNVSQSDRIIEICKELKTGIPIQYILGETIFYDCVIRINRETLIPRSETEELVDIIIRENRGFRGNIIDIGTGSGCIAIALAKHLPESSITGIDISWKAIIIARVNAVANNVPVRFIRGDVLNFEYDMMNKADIIVSNPPYVRHSEKQLMSRNVLEFEPHIALFVDDSDPLIYYKAIFNVSKKILTNGGCIYFEINEAMGQLLAQMFEQYKFSDIEIVKDINGKDRIAKGKKYV